MTLTPQVASIVQRELEYCREELRQATEHVEGAARLIEEAQASLAERRRKVETAEATIRELEAALAGADPVPPPAGDYGRAEMRHTRIMSSLRRLVHEGVPEREPPRILDITAQIARSA